MVLSRRGILLPKAAGLISLAETAGLISLAKAARLVSLTGLETRREPGDRGGYAERAQIDPDKLPLVVVRLLIPSTDGGLTTGARHPDDKGSTTLAASHRETGALLSAGSVSAETRIGGEATSRSAKSAAARALGTEAAPARGLRAKVAVPGTRLAERTSPRALLAE